MYEQHYGLTERPFSLNPDPSFLYPSRKHAAALTALEYGIAVQATIVVITGEVGSGKTTLIRCLLQRLDQGFAVGLVANTNERYQSLLPWICLALEIDAAESNEVDLYEAFRQFVIEQYGAGRRTLLIVDEAQNLSHDALEELRTLSNLNGGKDLVLQIILAGQPELAEKLARPEMRQLLQRVSMSYTLGRFKLFETGEYVRHRLKVAGGVESTFDDYACAAVHHLAAGIPRLINTVCDRALVHGYAEDLSRIGLKTVLDVYDEMKSAGLNILDGAHC